MNYFAHPIFDGITEAEWEAMQALHAFRRRRFARGEMILRTGERTRELGLVCAGSVHIESGDAWGGRSILSHVGAGEVFAETYALCGQTLMVDAVAAEDSEIVFAAPAVLLDAARQQEGWYGKLTRNLLRITARKNHAFRAHFLHGVQKRPRTAAHLPVGAGRAAGVQRI